MKDIDLTQKIDLDLNKNEQILRKIFENTDDIIFRKLEGGKIKKLKMLLFYVDGMTSKEAISEYAISSLLEGLDLEKIQNMSNVQL